jgi:hypothetical protein
VVAFRGEAASAGGVFPLKEYLHNTLLCFFGIALPEDTSALFGPPNRPVDSL